MTDHVSSPRLAAYFDGIASGPEAVESHLAECAACRSRVAAMAGARRAIQLLPMPVVPDRVWDRIDRRLQPAPPPRRMAAARPPRRRARPPAPAAESASPPRERTRPLLLLCAMIGLLLVVGPMAGRLLAAGEPTGAGFDYGSYLAGLTDERAMDAFESRYARRRLPIRPGSVTDVLVGENLLDAEKVGLLPRTAYALTDEGVRSVQVTYVHGRSLADVFRQPADHPARLEGFSVRGMRVGGIDAEAADGSTHRAVTFISGESRYVVVARKNDPALPRIVARFASLSAGARADDVARLATRSSKMP